MTSEKNESKLTPAAREALEEFTRNYRDQILRSANQVAGKLTGEVREISVRDIFEAISIIETKGFPARSRQRSRLSFTLTLTGLLYSLVGFGFYIYTRSTSTFQNIGILLIVGGIACILAGLYFNIYYRDRSSTMLQSKSNDDDDRTKELEFIFLDLWQLIELETRNLASQILGESKAKSPSPRLVDELITSKILSYNDSMIIRNLLNLRNNIVHNRTRYPKDMLVASIKQAEALVERMRRFTK